MLDSFEVKMALTFIIAFIGACVMDYFHKQKIKRAERKAELMMKYTKKEK